MILKRIKLICSYFYLLLYQINSFLFKYKLRAVYSSPSYVISVGNLSVGGSGKTPMVELIASRLLDNNFFPVIVSRGYKRASSKMTIVSDGKRVYSNVKDAGDEPYMLAMNLYNVPVIVGKKFHSMISAYKTFNAKTILLDDSFQTRKIKKNLDILLIDVSVNINQYHNATLFYFQS